MTILRTSKKGHVLIPKRLRKKLGIEPGAKVLLIEGDDSVTIKPTPPDPIAAACGFLKGDFSLTEDLRREHEEESKREKGRSR